MEKTKKKKYFFQVLLINIKLEELRPPARTSRAPSTLPVPRSWITQNFNPPPPLLCTPSRGLHHLARFALFIFKYDKLSLL